MATPDEINLDRLRVGRSLTFTACQSGFIFTEEPEPDAMVWRPRQWAFGTIEDAASWLMRTYALPSDAARKAEEEDRV